MPSSEVRVDISWTHSGNHMVFSVISAAGGSIRDFIHEGTARGFASAEDRRLATPVSSPIELEAKPADDEPTDADYIVMVAVLSDETEIYFGIDEDGEKITDWSFDRADVDTALAAESSGPPKI